MSNETSRLLGTVIDREHRTPVPGAVVEVQIKGLPEAAQLPAALSDADGRFAFTLPRLGRRRRPLRLDVHVFQKGKRVIHRELESQSHTIDVALEIDCGEQSTVDPSKRTIDGRVLDAHAGPRPHVIVRAFDKRLREDSLLGEVATDAEGRFHIAYSTDALTPANKSAADLFLRAYDDNGAILTTSPIHYQAPSAVLVDLVIGGDRYVGPSQYERLQSALLPILGNADISTLTDDEITYLAETNHFADSDVRRFVRSLVLGKQTQAPSEALFALLSSSDSAASAVLARPRSLQRTALQQAVADNIIPFALGERLDEVVAKLNDAAVRLAIAPSQGSGPSLGDLLDVTRVPATTKDAIARAFIGREESPETIWKDLRAQQGIDSRAIDDAQRALQLSVLTGGHLPMIRALESLRAAGSISTLRDLATLPPSQWMALVQSTGAPADTPGATDEERKAHYTERLSRSVEEAFPTPAFAARLSAAGPQAADVRQFFRNNPDLELRTTSLDGYLAAKGTAAWSGIGDRAAALNAIRATQRILKLTPFSAEAQSLLALGLTSARSIVSMGRNAFVAAWGNVATADRADALYRRASNVTATTLAVFTRYAPSLDGVEMRVLPRTPSDEFASALSSAGLPDYRTLFGSIDYCKCEDCRSVTSPAAYYVDVLSQMLDLPSRAELFDSKRRPDLQEIELSCANTNVPLPYVDLVNEILENAVSPRAAGDFPQTTWSADDLAASPEHLHAPAYDVLANAVYPWSLPFSLATTEARVYLAQRDLRLDVLMSTFRKGTATPSDFRIASEAIGLTSAQAKIIAPPSSDPPAPPPPPPWQYWGFATKPADWDAMAPVPVRDFLQRSGLSYDELVSVLNVDFVNPSSATPRAGIEFHDTECDLDNASVVHLSAAILDRLHRFIRLRRTLRWTDAELALAIRTFGTADIETLITWIAAVQTLKADTQRPVVELLSWFGPMDTRPTDDGGPSFYDSVYRNRGVLDDAELAALVLSPGDHGDESDPGSGKLSEHVSSILAALEITADEYALLTDKSVALETLDIAPELTSDALNLFNLSKLHRVASFARALQASVRDVLTFHAISGIDPFNANKPSDAARFRAAFQRLRSSGWRVADLDALLRGVFREDARGALSPAATSRVLSDLHNGLAKIAAQNAVVADPTGERTRAALGKITPAGSDEAMAKIIAIIGDDPALDLSVDERRTAIEAMLGGTLAPAEIVSIEAALFGPSASTDKSTRFAAVLTPILGHIRRTSSESFVKQRIAATLKVETGVADVLLTRAIRSPRDAARTALDELLDPGFVAALPDPSTASFDVLSRTLQKLARAALVISRMNIGFDELTFAPLASAPPWLVDRAPARGLLDLNSLPLDRQESGATQYAAWDRLRALIDVRDGAASSTAGVDLLRLLATTDSSPPADVDAYFGDLSAFVGATARDLRTLADGLGLAYPRDFEDGSGIVRLFACLAPLASLGASPSQVLKWAQSDTLTLADSAEIKSAVKSRYDRDAWRAIAKSLRDPLREKQRDALVDYLLHTQGFSDTNALFSHFLIDVEMSSCQLTSRIKQAIGSVQLFVQRMLLGLEPQDMSKPRLVLDATRARRWSTWMKSYRIWEANRKVFLHPENWIEPDLREDKTPFFEELESKLLQSDLTNDAAEQALVGYLEKLDAVSRAQVVGLYHDEDEDELHVIARTRGTPRIHYHRTRTKNGTWTAWDRVELDIASEWVLPVIWNRRLHLFWAVAEEKPSPDAARVDDSGNPPPKMLEIRFAYSEYRAGKWTPKRTTTSSLTTGDLSTMDAVYGTSGEVVTRDFLFGAFKEASPTGGEDLVIQCHVWFGYGPGRTLNAAARSGLLSQFRFHGCGGDVTIEQLHPFNDDPLWPRRTTSDFMSLAENPEFTTSDSLFLSTVDKANVETLRSTPGLFRLTFSRQTPRFVVDAACFMEDQRRSFFIRSVPRAIEWTKTDAVGPSVGIGAIPRNLFETNDSAPTATQPSRNEDLVRAAFDVPKLPVTYTPQDFGVAFETFYHPFVNDFIERLNRFGVDGLLRWQTQLDASLKPVQQLWLNAFADTYAPQSIVVEPYPIEDVDFGRGAFAQYNWELFFHVPLLMATRLSKNQRFEEALRWFHFIFDPTDVSTDPAPQKYWKVRKFYDDARTDGVPKTIEQLLALLGKGGAGADVEDVTAQIHEWMDHPFSPHAIARLRTAAYQKTVVMKYVDNLIAWGDQLFRRDTLEATNEAALLYVLAADILGPRPTRITPPANAAETQTFASLSAAGLDAFSDALVAIESELAPSDDATSSKSDGIETLVGVASIPYFCTPANDVLLSYWDTVVDRLFKLRHCMNIEGQVRQLPLFEPPIDPGLLVRAAAAGVDLASAVNDVGAPPPLYRFEVMIQRAIELVSDVRALGALLLSALEKRDAEALALLRAGHELDVLTAARDVRQMQIDEAQNTLDALQKSQELAALRRDYYTNIPFLIPNEQEHLDKLEDAFKRQRTQQELELAAGVAMGGPTITSGSAGGWSSPVVIFTMGGAIAGAALSTAARAVGVAASSATYEAAKAATMGEHDRRANDWSLQAQLAAKEYDQIGKQIIAAQIRLDIAQRELDNQDRQIENARAVSDFLQSKFTNTDLYDWMSGELAGIYFQTYQLAFDVARRAERAYRFERRTNDGPFVQFGYWDSLKKGLLAGERLHFDLRRMQAAYLAENRRELEITKHVSLALHDPAALIALREAGSCFIYLYDESIFDADYPGHYLRRIKSVSLSVPGVVGPYQSLNCTLTLVKHRVRPTADPISDPAAAYVETIGSAESIVTSTGQADGGMFEGTLRDERYLPFEGAGAMSIFRVELPKETNALDRSTLSDVVLHLRYTARDGGEALRSAIHRTPAVAPPKVATPTARLFRATTDFPEAWARFVGETAGDHVLELDFSDERFPLHSQATSLTIKNVRAVLDLAEADPPIDSKGLRARIAKPDGEIEPAPSATARTFDKAPGLGNALAAAFDGGDLGGWSLTVAQADLPPAFRGDGTAIGSSIIDTSKLRDVLFLCELEI